MEKLGFNPITQKWDLVNPATSTTGYVPYIGATDDVNLGAHNLYLTDDIGQLGNPIGGLYATQLRAVGAIMSDASDQYAVGSAPDIGSLSYDGALGKWSFHYYSIPAGYVNADIEARNIKATGNIMLVSGKKLIFDGTT